MADEKKNNDAQKTQKQLDKEALKAKKQRIKDSKPKKEGNVFQRIWAAIKKFWKDFKGTCKKVVWPDRKTVIKSTGVVILTVLVVGIGIWIVDFALTRGVNATRKAISNRGEETSGVAEAEGESAADELNDLVETTAAATEAPTEAPSEAA